MRFAFLMTGSSAVAEDAVAEVFRRLARRGEAVLDAPGPYLRTAVANEVRSWRRRRSAQRNLQAELELRAESPVSLGAWELLDALVVLSADERAVIVLHYYEGRTIDEIATLLGRPRGTVASWQCRALAKLRAVIER